MATKKTKKVPHLKTKKAEISIQFRGKNYGDYYFLLRPTLAEQLAFRLASPKRFLKSIKKRRK